ncbi:hypothetical protein BZG36_04707 [Bifiguratus adelaidae]|uniref:Protein kinase domain-containing protein n=1 Tax=Bifiguratus adelaidae TaxID=1938954 RepID=A0A261XWK2_9FUNG|nr:hypothetical protein BZG36_04707 [Bifiguratus adelaidae]
MAETHAESSSQEAIHSIHSINDNLESSSQHKATSFLHPRPQKQDEHSQWQPSLKIALPSRMSAQADTAKATGHGEARANRGASPVSPSGAGNPPFFPNLMTSGPSTPGAGLSAQVASGHMHPGQSSPSVAANIASLGHTSVGSNLDLVLSHNLADYEIGAPIGYGSSAMVYSAIYKPFNKRIAIKMIDLDMFERNQIDELRRETALMALSKHPNVLRVYGSFVSESKLLIVTPYLTGGSCLDIMKNAYPHGFEEVVIATILKQALDGLLYLHKNGHIHRDVKAGNLLVDSDGSVLLADFGVSSSLVESGESRGVRKTFVGTPCWMAPEVMEQAGYDYKADIWSFGITALELASGHAPFAKYPPLKVLMMTLSNDPPTLERDQGDHHFSKTFKEMIDLCLQKDPSKRPTAEKLIAHPFFKQAKRKEYLAKTILNGLTPLEARPHKRVAQKRISLESTEQWDFDGDPDPMSKQTSSNSVANGSEASSAAGDNNTKTKVGALSVPSSGDEKEEASGASVSFAPEKKPTAVRFAPPPVTPGPSQQGTPAPGASSGASGEANGGKKHISFGDVVVKNPPAPRTGAVSPGPASNVPDLSHPSPSNATRKSRFVIADTQSPVMNPMEPALSPGKERATHGFGGEQKNQSPTGDAHRDHQNLLWGLGMSSSPSTATPPTHLPGTPSDPSDKEVKKGRFSVRENSVGSTQSPSRTMTPVSDAESDQQPLSFGQAQTQSAAAAPSKLDTHTLSRENSASRESSVSRDGSVSKASRFSVEKEGQAAAASNGSAPTKSTDAALLDALPPALAAEYKKRGRFEVSGDNVKNKDYDGQGSADSPQGSSVNVSPSTSPSSSLSRGQAHRMIDGNSAQYVQSHLELLLRQNELTRVALAELHASMNIASRGRSDSVSSVGSSAASTHPIPHPGTQTSIKGSSFISTQRHMELLNTMNAMQNQIQHVLRENDIFKRENESLRREIERLRRSVGAANINVSRGPSYGTSAGVTSATTHSDTSATPVTSSESTEEHFPEHE